MEHAAILDRPVDQHVLGEDIVEEIIIGILEEHEVYNGPPVDRETARAWVDEYLVSLAIYKASEQTVPYVVPNTWTDRIHHRFMTIYIDGESAYATFMRQYLGYVPNHTTNTCVARLRG